MKIRRRISIKCWYPSILILLVMMSITHLHAQETPIQPDTELTQAPAEQTPNSLTGSLEEWIKTNPLTALLLGVFIPIIVGFVTWLFRDIITKMATDQFTWLLARFGVHQLLLNRYHRSLQRKFKEVGLTQQLLGEAVDLEKNYISLQLSKEEYTHPEAEALINSDHDSEGNHQILFGVEEAKVERVDAYKALANNTDGAHRVVIIGDPGSGKTTLLQYLAYQCTKGQGVRPIPALIPLTAYMIHSAMDFTSYIEAIFDEHSFPAAKSFLKKQFEKGNILVLFDGFDEVELGKRLELRKEIETFAARYPGRQNKFIVTSRPVRDATFENFRHLEMMPLTTQQRQAFLESKVDNSPKSNFNASRCSDLIQAIEGHDRVRKLAENPLLLTFLYHVYKYNRELPRRRVQLYGLSIDLMLDWDLETNRPTHIRFKDRDAKKEVLKRVAYYYHTHEKREVAEADLIHQVESYLPESLKGKFTARQFIGEIENSSSILRHSTAKSYQFIHFTFQEYLTADYINNNRPTEIPKLVKRSYSPWWREVILLLANDMGNATPLVSRILSDMDQTASEAEGISCTLLAFHCLYEGDVDANTRDQVLQLFVRLPHNQILDTIQSAVGAIEVGNEELEMLLINALNHPDEFVVAWGLRFLNDYPQLAEKSDRLTEHRQQISDQALQRLPHQIQANIVGELPFERIVETMWNGITADSREVLFDYLYRLYQECNRVPLNIKTQQKLLLAQSANLVRFLFGCLCLKSHQAVANLPEEELHFVPGGEVAQLDLTFTPDFVEVWRHTIPQLINILRVLILTLYPELDQGRDLDRMLGLAWADGLALDLPRIQAVAQYRMQARALDTDLIDDVPRALDRALDLVLERIPNRALVLTRLQNVDNALAQAKTHGWGLDTTWALVRDIAQDVHQARTHVMDGAHKLAPDVDRALTLALILRRAQAKETNRQYIELLALAQDLTLACAIIRAAELLQDYFHGIEYIHSFLETTLNQNRKGAWYRLVLQHQIHAASLVQQETRSTVHFGQKWQQKSDNPTIAAYQSAFFINCATLLFSFGTELTDTFFSEVLAESSNQRANVVLRLSYLLHRITTDPHPQTIQQEFRHLIETGGSSLERQWLELSGLTELMSKEKQANEQ